MLPCGEVDLYLQGNIIIVLVLASRKKNCLISYCQNKQNKQTSKQTKANKTKTMENKYYMCIFFSEYKGHIFFTSHLNWQDTMIGLATLILLTQICVVKGKKAYKNVKNKCFVQVTSKSTVKGYCYMLVIQMQCMLYFLCNCFFFCLASII